ncbi:MAG: ComF family protein [Bacteroidota bacterium]
MRWTDDFVMLFFPVNCLICGKRLSAPGEVICLSCELKMPLTGYTHKQGNPVEMGFWGRVPVEQSTSLFRFEKGSAYQSLLHQLKYKGNRKVGIYLGNLLGYELKHSSFAACDLIVPVPLHKKRLRQRGYNQSEIIARGASAIMNIPVEANLLIRNVHRDSQTAMGRYERFKNVAGSFRIAAEAPDINRKKVLLMDDVLTTGATLEACCQTLFRTYSCLVYIATVCCA